MMNVRFTPALFRHAEVLLSELLRSSFPADLVVSHYFRQHRELGHADRGFVAETVFSVLRRKRSLSARCADEVTSRRLLLAALACLHGMNRRELAVVLSESESKWLGQAKAVHMDDLPPAVRLDLPDWLHGELSRQFSAEAVEQLAAALNQPAPLDLRVNSLKANRQERPGAAAGRRPDGVAVPVFATGHPPDRQAGAVQTPLVPRWQHRSPG
jgi:16S rRNA (cytosine967-C5)-methyltransferase